MRLSHVLLINDIPMNPLVAHTRLSSKKIAVILAVSFFVFLLFIFHERVSTLVIGIVCDIFFKTSRANILSRCV